MKNDGSLIECPNCARLGKRQVLGRIMGNGELLVLRFHHGTTLLKSDNYELKCGCGYTWRIEGTVVTALAGAII